MALPDEETRAREFEAEWNLECGDVRVAKHDFEGKKQLTIFRRIVGEIDCLHNGCWVVEAKEWLRTEEPFDLINATPTDLAALDPIVQPYSTAFRWSDSSARGRRRAFRLTGTQ